MADWRRIIKNIITPASTQRGESELTKVLWNEPLFKYTTFHIGGNAECLVIINSSDDLKRILQFSHQEKIPYFIIGQGSNILISQQGLKGITIKLGKAFDNIVSAHTNSPPLISNPQLSVGAATPLSKLLRYAVARSLSGIEFVWGIPGSFGGAIYSNAGAFSQNIGDLIEQINGISSTGEDVILTRKELNFKYRKSNLPDGFVITHGKLKLEFGNKIKIGRKINEYQLKRKATQPTGASAGSVFRNPSIAAAGKLIDDCGLKGLKIKGACISEKHGNFIINQNNADFNDVYELIQIINSTVELKTGTLLKQEIQIFPNKLSEVR